MNRGEPNEDEVHLGLTLDVFHHQESSCVVRSEPSRPCALVLHEPAQTEVNRMRTRQDEDQHWPPLITESHPASSEVKRLGLVPSLASRWPQPRGNRGETKCVLPLLSTFLSSHDRKVNLRQQACTRASPSSLGQWSRSVGEVEDTGCAPADFEHSRDLS